MSLSMCSSLTRTSWRKRKAKNSQTLGTSNNYVTSTLRKDFQVFAHIRRPTRLYRCNFILNKVKSDSAFP
jgi:hypothetical protein